jgi:hypothetical protein
LHPAARPAVVEPSAFRRLVLAVLFVARLSMAFQFQSVASVGPILVAELGGRTRA